MNGFTLVELLVATIALGILVIMAGIVFIGNLRAMDNYSVRTQLWQEMDAVMDVVSLDARDSSNISVSGDSKSVSFVNNFGDTISTYTLNSDGTLRVDRGASISTLSDHVVPGDSSFDLRGGLSLVVTLTLQDEKVLGQPVTITSSMQVLPRNS